MISLTKSELKQCKEFDNDPVHVLAMKIRRSLAKGQPVSAGPFSPEELQIAKGLLHGRR